MKRFAIIAILAAFCMGAQAQEKLYTVKSGIVTMEMDMMGQSIVQEIYFDDYGAKKATVMNFGGQKSRNIVVDGATVMVNDDEKTAMKMPMMGQQETVNFSNLDEKTIKKYKVKELGKETVAGKECTKHIEMRDEFRRAYNAYVQEGEKEVFLGVAFFDEERQSFKADKVFCRG